PAQRRTPAPPAPPALAPLPDLLPERLPPESAGDEQREQSGEQGAPAQLLVVERVEHFQAQQVAAELLAGPRAGAAAALTLHEPQRQHELRQQDQRPAELAAETVVHPGAPQLREPEHGDGE